MKSLLNFRKSIQMPGSQELRRRHNYTVNRAPNKPRALFTTHLARRRLPLRLVTRNMDWLTFTTKIVEALAWPIASIVFLALLRKQVIGLLPLLKRVKAGPLEAEFERELKVLRDESQQASPQQTTDTLSPREETLYKLAELNPRSAILEAWQHVEVAARKRVLELGLHEAGPEGRPILDAYRALAREQVLNAEALALFHELRALRNQAAHLDDLNPSKPAAIDYIGLSKKLIAQLSNE